MDITDAGACRKVITESKVDAVIHCAAYTAVDAAEDNVDVCRKVNADGTRNIAEVCRDLDIKMMYISTDYEMCIRDSVWISVYTGTCHLYFAS